jgi:predicted MFS family arabinose efflux permease
LLARFLPLTLALRYIAHIIAPFTLAISCAPAGQLMAADMAARDAPGAAGTVQALTMLGMDLGMGVAPVLANTLYGSDGSPWAYAWAGLLLLLAGSAYWCAGAKDDAFDAEVGEKGKDRLSRKRGHTLAYDKKPAASRRRSSAWAA